MNSDAERSATTERSETDEWLVCGLIFIAAVVVRLLFLNELWANSYLGNILVSDAETYFQLAQEILSGDLDPEMPFWQAPLYPVLLAGVQGLVGESIRSIQFFHVAIGALNCVLVHRLTLRFFGFPSALAAALVAIFYAPFWLFDIQPLPANLTMLLDLLLAMTFSRYLEGGRIWQLAASALLLGLAIISHGLAIFTLPVLVFYLCWHGAEPRGKRLGRWTAVALFLGIAALPPALVSLRNSNAAGEAVFISYNAGINFYVGNHADLSETLARRGGYEWRELFREAYLSGAKAPAAQNRYFARKALEGIAESPIGVAQTQLRKLLMAFSAAEPKRNFPIYPLREDSRLLAAFLHQIEIAGRIVFAFPGGLVLPLVVLGFGIAVRTEPRVLAPRLLPGWIALFHIAGMIVFFPTARYRLPALILLLPYGAALVIALANRVRSSGALEWRGPAWKLGRPLPLIAASLVMFATANIIGPNVLRFPDRDQAENHYMNSMWALNELSATGGSVWGAMVVDRATRAMQIDPGYPDPVNVLAVYYLQRDYERAMALFERLRELVPHDNRVLDQIKGAEKYAPGE